MKKDLQSYYYNSFSGFLLASKTREKIIDSFVSLCKNNCNTFIEVGCAEGYYLKKFNSLFSSVVGLEFNEERAFNSKFNGNNILRASAEHIPFRDNSFDLVLCSEVLEHVHNWKKAFNELQRITKKYLIVTIPVEESLYWKLISLFASMKSRNHIHKLNSDQLINSLNSNFKLVSLNNVFLPFYLLNKFIDKVNNNVFVFYSCLLFEKT